MSGGRGHVDVAVSASTSFGHPIRKAGRKEVEEDEEKDGPQKTAL